MDTEYKFFKIVAPWLKENDYNLYKKSLEKMTNSIVFSQQVEFALKTILSDETLYDKEKWINVLVNIGNDDLMIKSLIDILKVSHIRENDFYVSSIMSEKDVWKRRNLIYALKNLKVYGNSEWYFFIREQEDE